VGNNPVNFNDPTGHNADCGIGDPYCQVKPGPKLLIQDRARYLAHKVSNRETSDLDAFASLADYAVSLTSDCSACVIDNLGSVITGHSDDDGVENYAEEEMLVIIKLHLRDHWYLDSSKFSQGGFADIFKDSELAVKSGGGNQAFHFFFYVQVGYQSGSGIGNFGVDLHEDILGNAVGKSEQDRYLGYEGVRLGVLLKSGDVSLSNLGDYIRETLSSGSPTSLYYEKLYNNRLNQHPSYQR
jgi:hypothetical protein